MVILRRREDPEDSVPYYLYGLRGTRNKRGEFKAPDPDSNVDQRSWIYMLAKESDEDGKIIIPQCGPPDVITISDVFYKSHLRHIPSCLETFEISFAQFLEAGRPEHIKATKEIIYRA